MVDAYGLREDHGDAYDEVGRRIPAAGYAAILLAALRLVAAKQGVRWSRERDA